MPGWAKGLVVAACLLVPVLIGGWIASQSVYFVGTDGQGRVTLYRGVPYDLPAGVRLYSKQFVTGVSAAELPPARRRQLLDHQLRTHDDAFDLIRQIDSGSLTG
jgi:protein phosphatase